MTNERTRTINFWVNFLMIAFVVIMPTVLSVGIAIVWASLLFIQNKLGNKEVQ